MMCKLNMTSGKSSHPNKGKRFAVTPPKRRGPVPTSDLSLLRRMRSLEIERVMVAVPLGVLKEMEHRLRSREARTSDGMREIYASLGEAVWKEYDLLRPHYIECENIECRATFLLKSPFSRQRCCSKRCTQAVNKRERIVREAEASAQTMYLAMLDEKMKRSEQEDILGFYGDASKPRDDEEE